MGIPNFLKNSTAWRKLSENVAGNVIASLVIAGATVMISFFGSWFKDMPWPASVAIGLVTFLSMLVIALIVLKMLAWLGWRKGAPRPVSEILSNPKTNDDVIDFIEAAIREVDDRLQYGYTPHLERGRLLSQRFLHTTIPVYLEKRLSKEERDKFDDVVARSSESARMKLKDDEFAVYRAARAYLIAFINLRNKRLIKDPLPPPG